MSSVPGRIGSVVADQIVDLTGVGLPALAHLAEILHDSFPTMRADLFLTAVDKHGVTQILTTLEALKSVGLPAQPTAVLFGGGGGGISSTGTPIGVADLEVLLQMLMRQLPPALVHGLTDLVAALVPASVSSAQAERVTQVLSIAAPVVAMTTPSVSPPPPPPAASTFTQSAPPPAEPISAAPPAPSTPAVDAGPSLVETPAPPTVEESAPDTTPPRPELTTQVSEPVTDVVDPPRGDDLRDQGADEGPGAGSQNPDTSNEGNDGSASGPGSGNTATGNGPSDASGGGASGDSGTSGG